MNNEREILARHLKELLEVVENPESDLSQLRHWFRYRWSYDPTGEEISSRLRRIETRLEAIEPQRCAFAEGDRANQMIGYITGIEGRHREERKHIGSWLSGTTRLTVVDPYFFSFNRSNKVFRTPAQYVESIIDFLPKTLEAIEVFHQPGPNGKIFSAFQQHCRKKSISLHHWGTIKVHDRVLIKSKSEAKVLGTSFSGLGNKIAFVLDLPAEDLQWFRRELNRIKAPVQHLGQPDAR